MHELYQTFGAGDLKSSANKAFKLAESGPVVILSRTQPKAVMVSPEAWNATAKRLAFLEQELRNVVGDMKLASMAAGDYVDYETFKAELDAIDHAPTR